jgi:hypothetical protein
MNIFEDLPFDELIKKLSISKKNIELLTLLGNLIDETKEIKVTYRGNEVDSQVMDFFLNGKYIESSSVQPKIFLDFRAAKIEQGFAAGSDFVIKRVFENIQNSKNESK